MNPADVAQYGIGFFAVACLVVIAIMVVKQQRSSSTANAHTSVDQLIMVIENNTHAVEELTKVTTSIQVSLAKQGAQQEEVLVRLRDQSKECSIK